MSDLEPVAADDRAEALFLRVSALVEQARVVVAAQANAALTLMYWEIGHLVDTDVLRRERADYAREIVASLGRQLTARFGRGFNRANLYRMAQFAQLFPGSGDCRLAGATAELDALQGAPTSADT